MNPVTNPWRHCLGRGIATGVLLWLSFFPANIGPLAFAALAPMLTLVRSTAPARCVYWGAWAGGVTFFFPALAWMRVADDTMVLGWIGLALYCSWYFPVALLLLRRIDARTGLPLALTAPIVWVGLEWIRSWFITGFPWYYLSHSQHDWLTLIQVSDLGGAWAVTLMVAAVNGAFADAATRGFAAALPGTLAAGLLVAGAAGYGAWRVRDDFASGPRVALVQTNISQDLRTGAWQSQSAAENAAMTMAAQLTELLDQAAAGRPDLIILPETSFPVRVSLAEPGVPDEDLDPEERRRVRRDREDLAQAGRRSQASVLVGVGTTIVGRPGTPLRDYNSALLVRPDGSFADRYDKIHRVPFGEYVPLEKYAPWLQLLTPYKGFKYGIDPGETTTQFSVAANGREFHFGALICYEDSEPALARQYLSGPAPVDFLVNISNDGWFRSTAEHEQHLAVCRFRAVECRRPVVRAVNMGISAVIDGDGRVAALPGATWATSKGVTGVVTMPIPLDTRTSFYAWSGDWLPVTAGMLTLLGCFAPRRRVTNGNGR